MSRGDILGSLTAAASAFRDAERAQTDQRARWARVPAGLSQALGTALLADPIVAPLHGMWAYHPSGSTLLDFRHVGAYLIDRALDIDPEAIVDDLLRFAVTKEVQLTAVCAVEGLVVDRVIDMGDGYSVEPPHSVPLPSVASHLFSPSNTPVPGWGQPPSCGFVARKTFRVPITPPPSPTEVRLSGQLPGFLETAHRMLTAAMLASTGAPQIRNEFYVITSPGWLGMDCGSYSGGGGFPMPVPYQRPIQEQEFRKYFRLDRLYGADLEMALSKLWSSRQRISAEERVIDLGTCVEMVLTRGEGTSAEITNKIATRASWLLGTDGQTRKTIFKTAKDLYSDRSKAVHTGSIPWPRGDTLSAGSELQVRLDSYDALCRELIAAVASSDFWTKNPDWTGLVLNALPDSSCHSPDS